MRYAGSFGRSERKNEAGGSLLRHPAAGPAHDELVRRPTTTLTLTDVGFRSAALSFNE
jgi:hypothetical protein